MNAQPEEVPEDGALIPAKQALLDAVHKLCGPQLRLVEGKVFQVPSRYMQLHDATAGEHANSGGGGGSKSQAPHWTDAFVLRDEIDVAIEIEQPAFSGVPATVGRLWWIADRKWRPMDVHRIEQIIEALVNWSDRIDALLDPEPAAFLYAPNKPGQRSSTEPAACTACGTRRVYRIDMSGERVQQPALKVTKDGCRCQRCHASWEPGQLRLLAAALGYPLPSGVLE